VSVAVSLGEVSPHQGSRQAASVIGHDCYLPNFACITEGKEHDVHIARDLILGRGTIIAIDRGHNN